MCNENINTLINLDFSSINDEGNWLHDSSNVVQTVGGLLVLDPSSNSTTFSRTITSSVVENRVRLKINLEVEKTDPAGPSEMEVLFQLYNNGQVIHESCIEFSNLIDGGNYVYFLDRTYKFDNVISTPLILKILVPEGWQHKVYLKDLVVEEYNFCEDNVRSYFIIDNLLEDSLTAQSAGIQLKNWLVDGVETLTSAFFAENTNIGGSPSLEWLFAKADLDGSNRVSESFEPNTFNPFINEFGLLFESVSSFYGGKPIGTLSGSDYGQGILSIGLEKPAILNGALLIKKGAFFIDVDYTKNLKVVFDVILNQTNTDVFNNPTYFREYTIEWNAQTCQKNFSYVDNLLNNGSIVDQLENGFLSGLTGTEINETIVECDSSFAPTGNVGNFSFVLDFGTSIGNAGINYNAYSVPDRFILEWNGMVFDSGFVGLDLYDTDLINAGVNPADINTGDPSTGQGQLTFYKDSAFPTQATVTVLAPLGGTAWVVNGICPETTTGSMVEVGNGICNVTPASWDIVYIDNNDPNNYIPQDGDIIYSNSDLTTTFNGGNDTYRMRVVSGAFQNILDYSFNINTIGEVSNVLVCSSIPQVTLTLSPTPNSGSNSYSGNLLITGLNGMDELVVTRNTPTTGSTSLSYAGNFVNPIQSFNSSIYSASEAVTANANDQDDGFGGDTTTGVYTFTAFLNGVQVATTSFSLFSDNNGNA